MLIPWQQLNPDTLNNLLEDFVTRDGSDNGDETPVTIRAERARRALEKGTAVIVFDPASGQCQLLLKSQVPPELLQNLA